MNADEVFHGALALAAPAEREAWLVAACGGDTALRAKVERLLAAHADAGSFLDGALFAGRPGGSTAPTPEAPGSVIGPYRLLQVIGEGGMGTVFMAEQTQPMQRRVALKVLKPGVSSPATLARFEAERQALALMDHPNIARVLDAGTVEAPGSAPRPYVVMELVHGVPITTFCDQQRLSPRERLELFIPVCRAVQHAHQKGVIHRDLKPSNILVCRYDGRPTPKVIDFGVAKAVGARLTDRTLFTEFGQVVGTLQYMSPEQAQLDQLDVDTRSDVYSLGVVLYELLSGSTPLERDQVREGALLEVLRRVREDEPPTPSARFSTTAQAAAIAGSRGLAPGRLGRVLRGDLDWIVMRSLEKDRNRRYDTAHGLANDLARYLAHEPVLAGPPSAWYRARKLLRRHPVRAGLVALGALLLVGGTAFAFWWQEQSARRAEERREVEADASRRTALLEREVAAALAEAEALATRAPDLVEDPAAWKATLAVAASAVERANALAGQAGGALDPRLTARVGEVRARVEADERDRGFVETYEQWRLDRARVDVSTSRFSDPEAGARLSDALRAYGIEPSTQPVNDVVAAIRDRPPPIQDQLVAAVESWYHEFAIADRQPHRTWFVGFLSAVERDPWRARLRVAVSAADAAAVRALGPELRSDEHPAQFVIRMAASLPRELQETELAMLHAAQSSHPSDFWANHELARALDEAGRHAEAARYSTAALAIRPRNPGELLNLAQYLKAGGESDAALAALAQALEAAPGYSAAYVNRGHILAERGDKEGALAAYREATVRGPQDARAWLYMGKQLEALGDVPAAVSAYRRGVELRPTDTEGLNALGWAQWRTGDGVGAVATFRRGLAVRDGAPLRSGLGMALASQHDFDGALAELQRAVQLEPGLPEVHLNLGVVQEGAFDFEASVVSLRKGLELKPTLLRARLMLGSALGKLGRSAEALEVLCAGRAHHAVADEARAELEQGIDLVMRTADLEALLPEVLAGRRVPATPLQWFELGGVAATQRRYLAAARLYEGAFAQDPTLAADVMSNYRWSAAQQAARAGLGLGVDAGGADDAERARWRAQALTWLCADVDLWRAKAEGGGRDEPKAAAMLLRAWQRHPDLAGLREPECIAALPADEQAGWRSLWADVAVLEERVRRASAATGTVPTPLR